MDENLPRKASNPKVGEDLYGLSLYELEQRISLYQDEITRLKTEMSKKSEERSAADALFKTK